LAARAREEEEKPEEGGGGWGRRRRICVGLRAEKPDRIKVWRVEREVAVSAKLEEVSSSVEVKGASVDLKQALIHRWVVLLRRGFDPSRPRFAALSLPS
jgi:hypothetical protein